jgi:hypothetical protein
VAPGARNKKRRAIAGASLRQAFAAEFERDATARRDAAEAASLFARKRKQDAEAEHVAWKKQQWLSKQSAFTDMMAERKKGPKPGSLDFEIARYVGAAGSSPAADKLGKSSKGVKGGLVVDVPMPKPAPLPLLADVAAAKKAQKPKKLDPRAEAMKALLQAESLGATRGGKWEKGSIGR